MYHRPWMFVTALIVALGAWSWSLGEALDLMRSRPTASQNASAVAPGGTVKPVTRVVAVPASPLPDARLRTAVASNRSRTVNHPRGSKGGRS